MALEVKRARRASVKDEARQAEASPSSKRSLTVVHNGRVYRSLADLSPSRALKIYDASNLLGEPDERATMPERQQRKRRRMLTPDPSDDEAEEDSDLDISPSRAGQTQLPTPPSSQHRQQKRRLSPANFDMPAVLADTSDVRNVETIELPPMYEAALAQHCALERGLVLHLATEGGKAAGTIASTSTDADGALRAHLPNLLSYSAMRKMVQLGSKKRLGEAELARLKWLWDLSPPLGYTIQSMREMDANGKKSQTWGLGVELTVQHHAPQSSLELVSGPPPSPGRTPKKTGSRDSMSIVALWTQASEARILEVRRRLGAFTLWQLRAHGAHHLTSPLLLPGADLPKLQRPSSSSSSSPSKASQELLERSSSSPIKSSGSLSDRTSSQLDRIKAKQAAKGKGVARTGHQFIEGAQVAIGTPVERMEELRERSALSRLSGIADGVHLLFSSIAVLAAPPSPSASLPTPPTRKRKAVPLDEVAALVAKSSRVALSDAEACDALELLTRVCPGYVAIREIERKMWVSWVGEMTLRETKAAIKAALAK